MMILCCGEALIDMVPDTNREGETVFRPMAGGAVYNTAIALSRLHLKTGFLSGISTDQFGQLLYDQLGESGVEQSFCIRSDRPTTLAVVELRKGEAQYRFYDDGSAGRMIEIEDLPQIPPKTSFLLFGGISLIADPCATTLEHLQKSTSKQYLIFLDPNIRASLIDNPASHRERINRMISHADIVKVSGEDLDWIAPESEPEAIIKHWLTGKTQIVLLTLGSEGAKVFTQNGCLSAPAENPKIVDTIGAGDTFNAGFLASIFAQSQNGNVKLTELDEKNLMHALKFAIHSAAISTTKKGADPPLLSELSPAYR